MIPERFHTFAKVLPEPLLLVTALGEIVVANQLTASMLGCSCKALVEQTLMECVVEAPETVLSYLRFCAKSRQIIPGSLTFHLANGDRLACRAEGAVLEPATGETPATILLRLKKRADACSSFVLLTQKADELSQEIKQRRQSQASLLRTHAELQQAQIQLIQSERLSALGSLVAGIAHEINNPVSFIHGNLTHVKAYIQDILDLLALYEKHYPEPVAEIQKQTEECDLDFLKADSVKALASIEKGAQRIKDIVLSLRAFSRIDEADYKAVDIHEGLESTLLVLQHQIKGAAITIVRDFGKLPLVECFAGQLNQVFMNILMNAIYALETQSIKPFTASKTPQITIRTEARSACVVIRIADNAAGMPVEVKKRIFDPFFTTKAVGKGTGMGMAISYQLIVEKHRGQLECVSEEGVGTELIIEIPTKI